MHFQGRELKPYAEPTSATELKEGSVYFFLNYIDDDMLIPTLEPVVFAGRNLSPNDAGRIYFQDIQSYQQGIRHGQGSEEGCATFYEGSEDQIGHVFDYDRALDELMRCALRRMKAQGTP